MQTPNFELNRIIYFSRNIYKKTVKPENVEPSLYGVIGCALKWKEGR